jgi:hypothetical protein
MGYPGMTENEARRLIERIEATWGDGRWTAARREEWLEELEPLDNGQAIVAFQQLKRTAEHPPKIATFLDAYRSKQRGQPASTSYCVCHGSGWIYSHFTSQDREGLMPNGQPKPPLVYEFVKPCPECSDGQRLVEPTNRIEIERERARTR